MSFSMRHFLFLLALLIAQPVVGADDKPPAKPGDARRAALVKSGYTAIPLIADPKHLGFEVDCAIGSEKGSFILDSGSMVTFLDMKVANRLNLNLGAEVPSFGLDGKQSGRQTYVPGLKIGSYETEKDWPNLPAQAIDMSRHPGSSIGVLGVGVLDIWAAVIDYPARAMYLRPPLNAMWPKLAGTWTVTNWLADGEERKLDSKSPPIFTFADRRLKVTDDGKIREYAIRFAPSDDGDYLLLINPKDDAKPKPKLIGGGLIKIKNGEMTLCLILATDKSSGSSALPLKFASPKGSGYSLIMLKCTTPEVQKPRADPLRELLIKEGYKTIPLDREMYGLRMTNARIGRQNLCLMVDTGMTLSGFDTAYLNKLGAMRLGEREEHALRGKVKSEDVELRGMQIGDYDTRRAFGVIYGGGFDLAGLNNAIAEKKMRAIQGFLGNLDLLNGSAVIDFGTNTLYLKPVRETVGPLLEGKWVGVRYEFDGRKGIYKPGDGAVEFKDGRVWFTTKDGVTDWGFHLEDELDLYRVGLFDPKADEMADGFKYASGGLLKWVDGKLTIVMEQAQKEANEFAAPKGSGLLLVEYERAK